jgi:hypothetical protein
MGHGDELLDALSPVVRALDGMNVAYFVGGSVASAAHGEFRATNDVDLIAALRPEHAAPLAAALGDAYYASEAAIREGIARRSSFNVIHLDTMLKIDVFTSRGRAYDDESLRRRIVHPLGAGDDAPAVHLAAAEDIVLAKLDWYRAGGETSERQWNDILGVLRVQADAIDIAYLRRWAAELEVDDLLERAVLEAATGPADR